MRKSSCVAAFLICCGCYYLLSYRLPTLKSLTQLTRYDVNEPTSYQTPHDPVILFHQTSIDENKLITYKIGLPSGVVDEREEYWSRGENAADTKIIYNRVPKCGSSSVLTTLQKLCKANNVSFLHSLTFYTQQLTPEAEETLVRDLHNHSGPWIFDRHVRMLNFSKYSLPQPVHINVFREPAERHRSHYYFRNELYLKRNMSFDECVARRIGNCSYSHHNLRYFCGHDDDVCGADRDDTRTLQIAKRNVEHYYALVGVTEELNSFFQLLEIYFPTVFRGALEMSQKVERQNSDSKIASHVLQDETRAFFKESLWAEYDFYEWVKHRLYVAKVKAGIK